MTVVYAKFILIETKARLKLNKPIWSGKSDAKVDRVQWTVLVNVRCSGALLSNHIWSTTESSYQRDLFTFNKQLKCYMTNVRSLGNKIVDW